MAPSDVSPFDSPRNRGETAIETIEHIVKSEYAMLNTVNAIGGRAWCQNHFDAFRLMRTSQFLV